ncbi:class F sortase [Streptomyces sp. ISL-98]|uniref:class F sortase n=1 Tax=Streptomyces sp. ISL-98 TaxID=2819192 RepID=UPI001BE6E8B1|nr:class F sortase [Streptomyces sp. ISL-98]MBT2508236.1 class F sortase [Streptomyces sp. ISL-98]
MARRRYRYSRRQRRLFRLARTLVLTWLLVQGVMWWAGDGDSSPGPPSAAGPAADGAAQEPSKAEAEARSKAEPSPKPKAEPPPAPLAPSPATRLAIPAFNVAAPVVGLGLDKSGRLITPPVDNPRLVGWYNRGPSPGEKGTAVVVGHRDTRTGPAIFLNLKLLKPGNTVRLARKDGRVAVFTVDSVRTYEKSKFPDKEVYGSTGRPELRVLTCGGAFDRKAGYASNVVVFAHLTDVTGLADLNRRA